MSDQHKFNLNFNDDDVIQFDENCLTRFNKLRRAIWENGKERLIRDLNNILNPLCSEHKLQIPSHYHIIDSNGNIEQIENNWSKEGVYCEILRMGSQQWEIGRIRIKFEIEFISDKSEIKEPESCLDDIRREINQT